MSKSDEDDSEENSPTEKAKVESSDDVNSAEARPTTLHQEQPMNTEPAGSSESISESKNHQILTTMSDTRFVNFLYPQN
jgi:hypothetical protein